MGFTSKANAVVIVPLCARTRNTVILGYVVVTGNGYIPLYIDKVVPSERHVEVPSPELAPP